MKKITIYRTSDKRFVRYAYLHSAATPEDILSVITEVLGGPTRAILAQYFWEVSDIIPVEGVPR